VFYKGLVHKIFSRNTQLKCNHIHFLVKIDTVMVQVPSHGEMMR